MRRFLVVACLAALAAALGAQVAVNGKVLYVYDEVNDQSKPYIAWFKAAFAAEGIAYDEATASQMKAIDPSKYRALVVHGMVMAFNSKSPVRNWLKAEGRLAGERVSLFVTANRWFLDKLYGQLTDLLKKDRVQSIDGFSAATKSMDAAAKEAAVRAFVARLK